MKIPLSQIDVRAEDIRRMDETAASGWIMQGPRVEAFEGAVARHCGAQHAVATSSGTTALHLALLLAGVKPGDEMIVPSFSWIASANAVVYTGATPVFCDVDPRTYNMTVATVAPLLGAKTRAILLVHQFGMPCDLAAFAELARNRGVVLVEDAACAIGSLYGGESIGNGRHALSACLSFHPRKVVTTGEGGMLLTNDGDMASKARSLRNHGAEGAGFPHLGYNYRLTDLQAALGVGQIERLSETIHRRRAIAARYQTLLDGVAEILLPVEPEGCRTNWQSFMVRLAGPSARRRDAVAHQLAEAGIATRPGIAPIHLQPCHAPAQGKATMLPCTEAMAGDGLVLPLHALMKDEEVNFVGEQLKKAIRL